MRWNTTLVFAAALTAAGCSTASSPSHSGSSSATWSGGAMELRLVDAPADMVKEIVVTIRKVTAHSSSGGWIELSSAKATVDLLKLQNGTFASLGVSALPSGRLTQIRLLVDEGGPNYVTTPDDVQHPLKVPSGTQSGIKLKLGVELPDCPVGTLTIDFDGKKSIFTHPTGSGDEWILRPVVRLKAVTAQPGDCSTSAPPAPPATDPPSTIDGMDPPATSTPPTTTTTPPSTSTPPTTTTPTTTFTPPISTGEPVLCGGMTCADGLYCYNGECVDGYTIY